MKKEKKVGQHCKAKIWLYKSHILWYFTPLSHFLKQRAFVSHINTSWFTWHQLGSSQQGDYLWRLLEPFIRRPEYFQGVPLWPGQNRLCLQVPCPGKCHFHFCESQAVDVRSKGFLDSVSKSYLNGNCWFQGRVMFSYCFLPLTSFFSFRVRWRRRFMSGK